MFSWENTKKSLCDLEVVLLCMICKKMPSDPVSYIMCGHFFCKSCVKGVSNACPVCGIPSLASEIKPDPLITNLISGWKKISRTVGLKSNSFDFDNEELQSESKENTNIKFSEINSVNKLDKKNSESTSDVVPGENSDKETEPAKKKIRTSRGKESYSRDTQKSETTTIVRKCRTPRNSTSKDINKKNAKGETQLHVACIKGKVDQVKVLLEEGADPNTKDYAGWTPLLEAVNHGFNEIVELLLKNGVMVNVPGCDNITPLHEAVLNNKLEVVKSLLMFGANPEARDVNGLTPVDIAKTEEMKAVLSSKVGVPVVKPSVEIKRTTCHGSAVLFGCCLAKNQQKQLVTLARQLKTKLLQSYSSEVTHIIVQTDTNNVCPADKNVLQGILQGKWIVNCSWLDISTETGELINPEPFEIKGTSNFPASEAPMKGRNNAEIQLPGIFNGCHFYLSGVGITYLFGNQKLTKADVTTLIRSGSGLVLSREPDPENIPPEECTVPYHAPFNGVLSKCSHFIIYKTGRDEPKLKYNMTHIKSLPIQWLFDCMESFRILDPVM